MSAPAISKPVSEFPDLLEALEKAPEQERNDRNEALRKISSGLGLEIKPWEDKEDNVWLVAYAIKRNPNAVSKEERELIMPPEEKQRVLQAWDKFRMAIENVPLEYIREKVEPLREARQEYEELHGEFNKLEITIRGDVSPQEKEDAKYLGKTLLKATLESHKVGEYEAHTSWRSISREDLPHKSLTVISRSPTELINYKHRGELELPPRGINILVNGEKPETIKIKPGDTINIDVFPRPKDDKDIPTRKGTIDVKLGVTRDERDRRNEEFIQRKTLELHPNKKSFRSTKETSGENLHLKTELRKATTALNKDSKATIAAQIRDRGHVPLVIKNSQEGYDIYIASLYKLHDLKEEGQEQFIQNLAKELAAKIVDHNKKTPPGMFNKIAQEMCTPDYRGHPDWFKDPAEEEILKQLLPLIQKELQALEENMVKEIDRIAILNFTHDWEGSELFEGHDQNMITRTQLKWYEQKVLSVNLPPKSHKDNQIRLRGINIENIEHGFQINEQLTIELFAKEIVRILSDNENVIRLPGSLGKMQNMEEWLEKKAFSYTFLASPKISSQHKAILERIKQEALRQVEIESRRVQDARQRRRAAGNS